MTKAFYFADYGCDEHNSRRKRSAEDSGEACFAFFVNDENLILPNVETSYSGDFYTSKPKNKEENKSPDIIETVKIGKETGSGVFSLQVYVL